MADANHLDQITDVDERELVKQVLRGCPVARDEFRKVIERVPNILAASNTHMRSPLAAQDLPDLVQDTLVVIWRKLPQFEGRSSLLTWVYRICVLELHNAARKSRRSRHRGMEKIGEESEEAFLGVASSRSDTPHAHLEDLDLYQGLERLSGDEQRLLRLRHYDSLTFDEIAGRLEVSPSTAKERYHKALARLRRHFRVRREGVR